MSADFQSLSKIKVAVRIRPMLTSELESGHESSKINIEGNGTLTVKDPRGQGVENKKVFKFDQVFGQENN